MGTFVSDKEVQCSKSRDVFAHIFRIFVRINYLRIFVCICIPIKMRIFPWHSSIQIYVYVDKIYIRMYKSKRLTENILGY